MKNWEKPEVKELNLAETSYGSAVTTKFDYIYQNSEGNWEGTFEEAKPSGK